MNVRLAAVIALTALSLHAQEESAVTLPRMDVASGRVANLEPAGSVAMPITALRFEPLLDVQARNMGEGQSDVTIRGGIFENTGFRIGGVSLYDPQTGHYFAEIPVAPAMLEPPRVLTGVGNALSGFNANVGTVAYGWRPVATAGVLSAGAGTNKLERQSLYQGWVTPWTIAGGTLAVDTEFARSSSEGTIAFGDHEFSRANLRLQRSGARSQTDMFAGYQEKFFGWPNLYTPFGVHETENLQSVLLALNHRTAFGAADFFELGGYYRRNKDDYEYSRERPGLYNPYQHATWARSVAVGGHNTFSAFAVNYSAQVLSDDLHSTALTAGRFSSRSLWKAAFVPEKSLKLAADRILVLKAGASFDDTNRNSSAVSPVVEVAVEERSAGNGMRRGYLSYGETTQVATYTALNSSPASGLFRGNSALDRARSRNFEAGFASSQGAWSVQSAVFARQDESLVDWTYSYASTAARRANPVDIDTVGLETVVSYTGERVRLVLGYTFLEKDADYRGAPVDASFYALNFARHRLTLAAVVRIGACLEVRVDNAARVQEDNRLRVIGGDETLMSSVGLYYRPRRLSALEFSLATDNLWNSNFQEVPAVPAARRQVSAGAAYRW